MNSLLSNEPTFSNVATELRRYDAACAELLSLLRRQQRTPQEDHLCINGETGSGLLKDESTWLSKAVRRNYCQGCKDMER